MAFLMIFVLSLSTASASYSYDQVQNYVSHYNSRIANAPEPVKSLLQGLLGNERIELDLSANDGSVSSIGFETQDSLVSKITMGGLQDPTIIVTATESAIDRIRDASDPVAAFQGEMNYGQVRIDGTTLQTKFKLSVVLSSLPVIKFFSSIFFG